MGGAASRLVQCGNPHEDGKRGNLFAYRTLEDVTIIAYLSIRPEAELGCDERRFRHGENGKSLSFNNLPLARTVGAGGTTADAVPQGAMKRWR